MNFDYLMQPNIAIPEWIDQLILKYFTEGSIAYNYYYTHCLKVTEFALDIMDVKSELNINKDIVVAGGMLHDIGIVKTHAPKIGCFGEYPYIAHTYLGREIIEKEGYPEIAPMCERHVGTGLSKSDIIKSGFPLPHRDMLPITIEEKLICYADKFYSKSEKHLTIPRTLEEIRQKVTKYGEDKLLKFNNLHNLFGK